MISGIDASGEMTMGLIGLICLRQSRPVVRRDAATFFLPKRMKMHTPFNVSLDDYAYTKGTLEAYLMSIKDKLFDPILVFCYKAKRSFNDHCSFFR